MSLPSKKISPQKQQFYLIMKSFDGIELEYKFHPTRRFKFDFAIPEKKIAIEYEGISGKSRHTSITGYTRDCEKYNIATGMGWRVFRYTALNYSQVVDDLNNFLSSHT